MTGSGTAAKIALGVFLTLYLEGRAGFFDGVYDALFNASAMHDADVFTRFGHFLTGDIKVTADLRNSDPGSFGQMHAIFAAVVALVSFVCMWPFLAAMAFFWGNITRKPEVDAAAASTTATSSPEQPPLIEESAGA